MKKVNPRRQRYCRKSGASTSQAQHTRNCVGRYKHKYGRKAAEKNRAEKETRLNTAWLNFKRVTRTVDPPSRRQRPSST